MFVLRRKTSRAIISCFFGLEEDEGNQIKIFLIVIKHLEIMSLIVVYACFILLVMVTVSANSRGFWRPDSERVGGRMLVEHQNDYLFTPPPISFPSFIPQSYPNRG